MSLIVDASVAIKWFSDELGSSQAEALLQGGEPLFAPDFVLAEIGNGLVKKVRRQVLTHAQAMTAMETAETYFDGLTPTSELIPQAARLALDIGHPLYDCLYLALALRESMPMITTDAKLIEAAGRARVEARSL